MAKYRLLRERILSDDLANHVSLLIPDAATDHQLATVHSAEYIAKLKYSQLSELEIKRIGFPWSAQTLERSRRSVGASICAGRSAMRSGVGVNLAGGTHHAFADSGQGYCVLNDVCVAGRVLQSEGLAKRIMFVDCDVHQGNGTAAITNGDHTMFSFSVHCDRNYPFRKQVSDYDLALSPGTTDAEYLQRLEQSLNEILKRFLPDIIFYLSGADPYEHDRLGLLSLTKDGLRARDELVFGFAEKFGIPVAVSMAGGYAQNVDDIVDIHLATVRASYQYWKRWQLSECERHRSFA